MVLARLRDRGGCELPSLDLGSEGPFLRMLVKVKVVQFKQDAINIWDKKCITTVSGYKTKSVYNVYVET